MDSKMRSVSAVARGQGRWVLMRADFNTPSAEAFWLQDMVFTMDSLAMICSGGAHCYHSWLRDECVARVRSGSAAQCRKVVGAWLSYHQNAHWACDLWLVLTWLCTISEFASHMSLLMYNSFKKSNIMILFIPRKFIYHT